LSKVVEIDIWITLVCSLKIFIESKKDDNFRSYWINYDKISLPCLKCKIECDSGKSRDYHSIASLSRHIKNSHKPQKKDTVKSGNLVNEFSVDDYLLLLRGLSVLTDAYDDDYDILLGALKTLLCVRRIYS